tara:strand:- start:139 stop:1017 length:879 start_codon:yes stop_codon:yes gene_type:complete
MSQIQIDQILKCPCCNNKNFITISKLDDIQKINSFKDYSKKYYQNFLNSFPHEKVILVKCDICLHLFYEFQPSESFLKSMYKIHQENKIKKKNLASAKMRKILSKISKIDKHNTVLDYGSGSGSLREVARELNLNYYAYEPSKERNLLDGEKNIFSSLQDLDNQKIKFDIIIINQVLEHLKDPLIVMNNLKNFCHSKSIIYVSVPNFNRSKEGSNFLSSWPYDIRFNHHTIAPFQHLHCFNAQSLIKLMANSGFKIKINLKIIFYFNIYILRIFLGLFIKKLSTTDIIFGLK